jgi:hypothetical protein
VDKSQYKSTTPTLFLIKVQKMKPTQGQLDKLEAILSQSGFSVRYERGTFQSGWCLLEQKKIVVLNKFLNVEGRINALLDLIPVVNISYDALTLESQKLYETVLEISIRQTEHTPT